MLDLLFYELFLLLAQVHLVHLDHEFVPSLFLFNLFVLLASVLRLNVRFDTFGSLSRTIRWLYLLTCSWLLGSLLLRLLRLASGILHPEFTINYIIDCLFAYYMYTYWPLAVFCYEIAVP